MTKKKDIVIIGAGFSGILSLVHIVNEINSCDTDSTIEKINITLIDAGRQPGGLAYGPSTHDKKYTLNAPIGEMEAFFNKNRPEGLLSLLEFLKNSEYLPDNAESWNDTCYCPRAAYGEYLYYLLEATQENNKSKINFNFNFETKVTSINKNNSDVEMHSGNPGVIERVHFDSLIIATGYSGIKRNNPPIDPEKIVDKYVDNIYDHHKYFEEKLTLLSQENDSNPTVLVFGSGLTAMDAVMRIREANENAKIYLCSRSGIILKPCPTPDYQFEELIRFLEHQDIKIPRNYQTESSNSKYKEYLESNNLGLTHLLLSNVLTKLSLNTRPYLIKTFLRPLEKGITCLPYTVIKCIHDLFTNQKLSLLYRDFKMDSFGPQEYLLFDSSTKKNFHIIKNVSTIAKEASLVINACGYDYNKIESELLNQLLGENNNHLEINTFSGRVINDNITSEIYCIGPICSLQYRLKEGLSITESISIVNLRERAFNLAKSVTATLFNNKVIMPYENLNNLMILHPNNLKSYHLKFIKNLVIPDKVSSSRKKCMDSLKLPSILRMDNHQKVSTDWDDVARTLNETFFTYTPFIDITPDIAKQTNALIQKKFSYLLGCFSRNNVALSLRVEMMIRIGYFLSFYYPNIDIAYDIFKNFHNDILSALKISSEGDDSIRNLYAEYLTISAFVHHNRGHWRMARNLIKEGKQLLSKENFQLICIHKYIQAYIIYVKYERVKNNPFKKISFLIQSIDILNERIRALKEMITDDENLAIYADFLHALGSMYRPLSRELEKTFYLRHRAAGYFKKSLFCYLYALILRIKVFGFKHIKVARSYDKLARTIADHLKILYLHNPSLDTSFLETIFSLSERFFLTAFTIFSSLDVLPQKCYVNSCLGGYQALFYERMYHLHKFSNENNCEISDNIDGSVKAQPQFWNNQMSH